MKVFVVLLLSMTNLAVCAMKISVTSIHGNKISVTFIDTVNTEFRKKLDQKNVSYKEIIYGDRNVYHMCDGRVFYEHFDDGAGLLFDSIEDFYEVNDSNYVQNIIILVSRTSQRICLAYDINFKKVDEFMKEKIIGIPKPVENVKNNLNRTWMRDEQGAFFELNGKKNKLVWLSSRENFEFFYKVIFLNEVID